MPREGFEAALQKARVTEKLVAEWLMKRGYRVLPVYDYSGLADNKAPKLAAMIPEEALVTPDLLAAKDGMFRWFEVKQKSRADFTRVTGRFETGIDYRLWTHYLKVKEITGAEVWLIFAHEQEDELRADEIGVLEKKSPRIYAGIRMSRSGMVFFPYNELHLLGKLSVIRQSMQPIQGAA